MPSLLSQLPPPPPGKNGWPWTVESDPLPPTMPDGQPWPKISIVTPSYNQGKYIEETIRSVLLQNYPNYEYIIIDGGSVDESVCIIKKYEKFIKFWISEADKGQANALNKGFTYVTGRYFAYINSDDIYLDNAFATLVKKILSSKSDLVTGIVVTLPDGKHLNPVLPKCMADWLSEDGFSLLQPGCFWRVDKNFMMFNENYHFVFDREYFWRIHAAKKRLAKINVAVAGFRLHQNSKTCSLPQSFVEENNVLNEIIRQNLSCDDVLILAKKQRKRELEKKFHDIDRLSLKSLRFIAKYVMICPEIVFSRPFYGRVRRLLGM